MQKVFRLTLILILSTILPVRADIIIDIIGGDEQRLPITLLPIDDRELERPLKHNIHDIISNNLLRSGFFSLVKVPTEGAISENGQIGYAFYRKLGIEHVISAKLQQIDNQRYEINIGLYDVLLKQNKANYTMTFSDANVRHASHQVSDIIFKAITGREGSFASRLAFVSVNKGANGRLYRLKIADSDGHNAKTILKSNEPILSPAWSPNGREIAYVSFERGYSAIYVQDPWKGRREMVAAYKGINSSPAWSPDGKFLLMTLSNQGNSEIYLMNLANKSLFRLTNHPAIDTEASFSSDGRFIFFTSDRSGSPQIHRISIANYNTQPRISGLTQITKEGSYNAGASLSQDGKYFALIHEHDKKLGVSLYDIENNDFYPITTTFLDDSPSLAPGANMLVYAALTLNRKDGQLIIMDIRGKSKIRLRTPNGEIKDPAWGPILKVDYDKR